MSAGLPLAADPAVIERTADPGEFVIQACQRARTWLREALEHGDIDQIAELKSQAEAVRVYTVQKQLGKDAQLAATEIVRRAERGMGLAIRRGQDDGAIRKRGTSAGFQGNQHVTGGLGTTGTTRPRPVTDFATHGELSGNASTTGIYAMTDGVSDEDFENAVAEAKAEENLTRANVVRKVRQQRVPASRDDREQVPEPGDRSSLAAARRADLIRGWADEGSTSRQIAGLLGIRDDVVRQIARDHGISIRADTAVGRTRRLDSNRIVRETVHALEGLAMGAGLVNPAELDKAQVPGWAGSLTASLRALNRLARTLKEEMTDD
jgi:hypothetical protein